jgi:phage-related tail fiber protein
MPLTQVPLNMLDPTAGGLSYRNKIINGCGWIDQRNNNSPVTVNSTANTFALPDLRGEFVRGWDDGRGIDTGRAVGTAQAQSIESHVHNWGAALLVGSGAGATATSGSGSSFGTSSTGGAETRPRNVALLACVKT